MLSYKKKIFIDRVFGSIVAFILNGVTRLLGLILCRNHGLPKDPKVVIVAKIVGIGSIIHTGVLCRALKITFPKTKLIYVTSITCKKFVSHMNYIDDILTINDSSLLKMVRSTVLLVYKMWRLRPELYFDLEVYSSWSSIIATLSLARNRYGFYRKSTAFRLGLHSHLLFFNTNKYLSDIYLALGNSAGADGTNNIGGLLNIKVDERQNITQYIQQLGLNQNEYIIVNPNASDLLIERRWPIQKWKLFLEIASEIWSNLFFLLVGAPSEKPYVDNIYNCLSKKCLKNIKNIAGQLTLGDYIALIEKCKAMITCDSGPMHISVALDRPTLSIWGPGNPQHYGTVKNNHRVIYEPVYCSPCLYHSDFPPCKGDNQCLKGISVNRVLKEFGNLINVPFHGGASLNALLKDEKEIEHHKDNKVVLGLVQR
jgi:ADP-heptose:LPS heptosyltransferase